MGMGVGGCGGVVGWVLVSVCAHVGVRVCMRVCAWVSVGMVGGWSGVGGVGWVVVGWASAVWVGWRVGGWVRVWVDSRWVRVGWWCMFARVCVRLCVCVCWWVSVCVGGCQCVLVGVSVCWWVSVCVGGCQCVGGGGSVDNSYIL